MFNIAPSELLLVAVIALLVIGPKDLPKAMRVVGYWVGKARAVSHQFRSGFDAMVREAELEEMEKRWAAENARIMAEHAPSDGVAADGAATKVSLEKADDPASDTAGTGTPVMVEKPVVTAAAASTPHPGEGAAS
ncbi:hypothetical protein ASE75_01975 [Sphingomonas sp. Leaf17]|uniref:Sec-independent protein translocase protein TatB n=1 Tax=Sphingomonas sp. Leaf17 TaxID=1735683 RepID=UPI0006F56531|nr:Sec-independent protein translocase protein TatB [Sphingomonas sp. Leaf17]KQM67710.1 hypothetical protein ASE75_01975 [Sphingomonas sp. Leaf17]